MHASSGQKMSLHTLRPKKPTWNSAVHEVLVCRLPEWRLNLFSALASNDRLRVPLPWQLPSILNHHAKLSGTGLNWHVYREIMWDIWIHWYLETDGPVQGNYRQSALDKLHMGVLQARRISFTMCSTPQLRLAFATPNSSLSSSLSSSWGPSFSRHASLRGIFPPFSPVLEVSPIHWFQRHMHACALSRTSHLQIRYRLLQDKDCTLYTRV